MADRIAPSLAGDNTRGCKSILIVEDDETIRDTLRLTLEFEGYTALTAEDGQRGLEKLPSIPMPCLILLDLMMPVMDGWAFAKALEKDMILATIPVIVVTAFADRAGSVARAKGILKKPIDVELLLKLVRQYCGNPVSREYSKEFRP